MLVYKVSLSVFIDFLAIISPYSSSLPLSQKLKYVFTLLPTI